jgi:hypothetical protein
LWFLVGFTPTLDLASLFPLCTLGGASLGVAVRLIEEGRDWKDETISDTDNKGL